MSTVVTTLEIDADTSGADAYTRAMDGAAAAAERGTGAASGFNLGLAVLGAGVAATAVGIKQGLDYVVEFNKSLADMGQVAARVGLSLKDLQGVQFGGQIAGLSEGQINTGLEKSAQLLNDAQRNANSLSKEFDVNGLSIRNANGQLISQNQLLQVAADLVRRADNPQDKIAIAQMLGFTKEWVPLLEQGAGAMRGLGDEAAKAGAVIDDETIKRAAEFDQQWRKSSVEWSTNMKAAIAELLPEVDKFIDKAASFIKEVKERAKGSSDVAGTVAVSAAAEVLKAAGVDPKSGIVIDTDALDRAREALNNSPTFQLDTWTDFGKAVWNGFSYMSQQEASEKIKGVAAAMVNEPRYPSASEMDAAFDKANPPDPGSRAHPYPGLTANDYEASNPSKVASRDAGTDAVDRAINSLTKHAAAQEADAKAVGLGDAALAGFRAQAAETAAVQANNGKETAEQAAKFAELRDRVTAAAEALAKAKVESQIDFNGKTAFLSQSDVAIANQLKGIYGNDVPKALDSTYAATLRVQAGFREASTQIEGSMVSGLSDIVSGAKSASQGFQDMSAAIIKAIEQMIIKLVIVEPLMRSLQGVAGGFLGGGGAGGGLGSLGITYGTAGTAGSNLYGPVAPSAHGNVFSLGQIVPFAMGGVPDIVSSPTIAPMAMFGEAGEEGIMPLRRGADGRLGVTAAGGSSQANVTINNYTDAQPNVERSSNGDVTVTLRKAVDGMVGDSMSTGSGRRVLSSQYGVKPFTGR